MIDQVLMITLIVMTMMLLMMTMAMVTMAIFQNGWGNGRCSWDGVVTYRAIK